jgi:hypothetical protein
VGYAEKRDTYWRGRYKVGPGKYATVRDDSGGLMRFRTRREAEQAADDEEGQGSGRQVPRPGQGPYVVR